MSQFSAMKSGVEMREHILGKAADDAEFRKHLVADPKAALNAEFGVNLPDSFAISVHEDSSTHVNLVLPPTSQLDENELKAVTAAHYNTGGVCSALPDDALPGTPQPAACW